MFNDTTVVLEGTGEGVAMRTPSGEEGIELPPALAGYEITALFEFSTNGANGQFQLSRRPKSDHREKERIYHYEHYV